MRLSYAGHGTERKRREAHEVWRVAERERGRGKQQNTQKTLPFPPFSLEVYSVDLCLRVTACGHGHEMFRVTGRLTRIRGRAVTLRRCDDSAWSACLLDEPNRKMWVRQGRFEPARHTKLFSLGRPLIHIRRSLSVFACPRPPWCNLASGLARPVTSPG